MIRFAYKNDLESIVQLWKISFPNTDEFSEWFFKSIYRPERTLVFEENGVIYSALQRLSFEMKNLGEVTYIFGACTHPDYRGRGLMSELLRYSEELDRDKNIKASVLIPQSEKLFRFYDKLGYEPKISIYKKKYTKQNPKDHSYAFRECSDDDISQLNVLYETSLDKANHIVRDVNFWKTQLEMFRQLGGNVFCLEHDGQLSGFAFVWNDDEVVIQELVGLNHDVRKILCHEIVSLYNVESAEVFSLTGNASESPLGCIKLYSPFESDSPFVMNLLYN